MVDLDAPFGEEFLKIPIGQSVAQVPAHGDQDDFWREPESDELRLGRLIGRDHTKMSHPYSLVQQRHHP
jgi:hypothetical protein